MFNSDLAFFAAGVSLLLSVFVVLRESRSFAQRALVVSLLLLAVENLLAGLSIQALAPEEILGWQYWRLLAMSMVPGSWLAFSLTYGRGADCPFPARFRLPLLALILAPPGLAAVLTPHLVTGVVFHATGDALLVRLGRGGVLLHVLFLLGAVTVLMNLERTLRAATGTMRWRIKFMVLGLGILIAVRIYVVTQNLLFSCIHIPLDGLNAGALVVCEAFIFWSLLRMRLESVNLYPSHAVIFHSLTLLLAGIYLFTVGILARVVSRIGGAGSFPLKAFFLLIGLIGLTALLLSDRIRQKVKRFVSRHFQRPQYDYRQVWEQFTHSTAAARGVPEFCRAATRLVSETFEVLSVTLWLIDDAADRLMLGNSTSIGEAQARDELSEVAAPAPLIAALRQLSEPVDLDATESAWAEQLRQCNPSHFAERGGHRLCVPLAAGGSVHGVMILADRVRGVPYSTEELDLLRTIGGHLAANLLVIKLSDRLLQSKQLEAFQAMSAFFVHDLKNTSSTLHLMLQNLPKHFGDPSFREDALKAISRSVTKINELIRRLTMLRQKLEIRPVPTDLNALVEATLGSLAAPQRSKMAWQPGTLPPLALDPEQIQKVVLNLLLNAHEATRPDGHIEVETSVREAWALISVRDDGSGMSREFVEQSLFRPFKSTKKEGMGIGLFHSRMIVEAHKGRVEVDSRPGEGSTFRLLLPVKGFA